jgi:hypothetical protein
MLYRLKRLPENIVHIQFCLPHFLAAGSGELEQIIDQRAIWCTDSAILSR